MPLPTPFHPRTAPLCTSYRWKDWAGCCAVCAYDSYHEREYFALRYAAGLVDVSPLFKYDVHGPDAAAFLSRIMARDVQRLKVGQVTYGCWCDDRGKLLDDGTIWRLDERAYRVTAAEPNLHWLLRHAAGQRVTVQDSTDRVAALSLQGPCAREVLRPIAEADVDGLKFFRLVHARVGGVAAVITRTGYTGDLGYELWVERGDALPLWDAVMDAGRPVGLEPAGLDVYDMCRVEAGFIMNGVDYHSANRCLIDARASTPYEAGLGWTVQLDREPFIGQAALRAELARGPAADFVGLELDWDEYEALWARHGLPPEVPRGAWRIAVPVYRDDGVQVGRATSGAWSPMLKKNLALATVNRAEAGMGHRLRMEVTVEYERHTVTATVSPRPFFDPPRKRT
jgi:aminomethyltransferase